MSDMKKLNAYAIHRWRTRRAAMGLTDIMPKGPTPPRPKREPKRTVDPAIQDKRGAAFWELSQAIDQALHAGITPFQVLAELAECHEDLSGSPSTRLHAAVKAYRAQSAKESFR